MPKEFKPYFNDYKIFVFEIAHLPKRVVEMFISDFRFVAEYYWQKAHTKDYKPSKRVVKHVKDVCRLLRALTGDGRYEIAIREYEAMADRGKRRITMCEMLNRIENRGIAKGRAEGEAKGKTEGKLEAMVTDIRNLMSTLKLSADEAMKALKIPAREQKKILAAL